MSRSHVARCAGRVSLEKPHVAEVQIGGRVSRIELDRRLEASHRLGVVRPLDGLKPELVFEEREDLVMARFAGRPVPSRELEPRGVRLRPLVLFLVQLLEIRQRVLVVGIEAEDLAERFERAVDEPAALVVEPQAEQNVGMLELAEVRPLKQRLMFLDGSPDLALFAVQVAEDQVDFQRISGALSGARQFLDGRIDLVADEEVQPEHVVGRFARTPPIDPAAVAELVAFPRLADGEPGEERDQSPEQYARSVHQPFESSRS